jgi:Phosphoesterase family
LIEATAAAGSKAARVPLALMVIFAAGVMPNSRSNASWVARSSRNSEIRRRGSPSPFRMPLRYSSAKTVVLRISKLSPCATRQKGNNWWNTLLIITFDEHGGCFDHVAPLAATSPDPVGFNTGSGEEDFDFKRLGVRVPMVMVSAHIAANTIVNTQMDHCSFLKTMQQKWGLKPLGPRQDAATPFTEVFAASSRSLDTWPDFETYPGEQVSLDLKMMREIDLSTMPLNVLQGSILTAIHEFYAQELPGAALPTSAKDALDLLNRAKFFRFPKG